MTQESSLPRMTQESGGLSHYGSHLVFPAFLPRRSRENGNPGCTLPLGQHNAPHSERAIVLSGNVCCRALKSVHGGHKPPYPASPVSIHYEVYPVAIPLALLTIPLMLNVPA